LRAAAEHIVRDAREVQPISAARERRPPDIESASDRGSGLLPIAIITQRLPDMI
jgi:hypothetical protein